MEKHQRSGNESSLGKTDNDRDESNLVTRGDGSHKSTIGKTGDGSDMSNLVTTGDGSNESNLVTRGDGSHKSTIGKTGDGNDDSAKGKTGDGSDESKSVTTRDGSYDSRSVTADDDRDKSTIGKTGDGNDDSAKGKAGDGSDESKSPRTGDGNDESKLPRTGDGNDESKSLRTGDGSTEFVLRDKTREDRKRQGMTDKMERGHKDVAASVGEMGDSRSQVQLLEERAVLVEELPRDLDRALELKLQIHFQSKQKSGGGECHLLSHPKSRRKVIVEFTSQNVRDGVLAKGQHVIEAANGEKVTVRVTAFTDSPAAPAGPGATVGEKSNDEDSETSENYKCEEQSETPKDKSTDKPGQPKAFEETVNQYLLDYITSNEQPMSELEKVLEKNRCKFKVVETDTISFFPDIESITDHIEWQGLVTKVFRKFTEGYSHETIKCTEKEWKEVEETTEHKWDVKLSYKNGIQLTGKSGDVERVKTEVENFIIELQQETFLIDIEYHYIELLQDELHIKFPDVQFHMDKKASRVCLKGFARELADVNKCIKVCIQNADKKKCNFGSYLNEFLRKTNLGALVQTHFTGNKIKALCGFDQNEIYIYSLQGYAEQAYDTLNSILKDLLFPVTKKHAAVMKSEQWNIFFKQLEHKYSNKNVGCLFTFSKCKDGSCNAIYIAGISEAVEMADKELTRYFKDNIAEEIINLHNESMCKCILEFMKIVDHPALKSAAVEMHNSLTDIVIMGHRDEVEKQKQSVNNAVLRINKDLEINERGVPDEERISGLLERYKKRNSSRLTGFKEEFPSEAGASKRSRASGESPAINLPGNRFLFVQKENILLMKVDVIVNAANENLDHLGGLAKVLSNAAGREFQHQSDLYVRKHGQVRTGEVAMTGPGQLPFKKVFHAVGPRWGDYSDDKSSKIKLLETVITNVLKKADEERFKSIAIPAISAGIFAFPLDICTRAICKAIFEYCTRTQKNENTLTDIHIVDVNREFIYKMKKTIALSMNDRGVRSEEESSTTDKMQDEKDDEDRNMTRNENHYGNDARFTDQRNHKAKHASSLEMDDLPKSSFMTKEGRTIQVVTGNIEDQSTDVIVNSTSIKMKLDIGGAASAALLRQAGSALQHELSRKTKYVSLDFGDIISTETLKCNLFCKKVYHIALRPDEKNTKSVYKAVLACLKKAHDKKETSISFPALGTGNLKYPANQVVHDMVSATMQFNKEHQSSSLQVIQFVILRSNPDIFGMFKKEICNAIADVSSEATVPNYKQEKGLQTGTVDSEQKWKIQRITVEMCIGDITHEKTDAIVNSTDTSMRFTSEISKAIFRTAGRDIEDEVLKAHPNFGNILVTSAGSMRCKHIMHIVGLEDNIENPCAKILRECQLRKLKSVSFPALGTGEANVDPCNVARSMFIAIETFAKDNKSTTLTNIRIVFVDNGILDIFKSAINERISFQTAYSTLNTF